MQQKGPSRSRWHRLLLISGAEAGLGRLNPDLQQPAGIGALVDFAVHDAGAGTQALHFPCPQHGVVTHGVGVGQFPLHHHGDDLHVAVGMHAEAPTGADGVVVDHAQWAVAHPVGMVVAREGKAVPGVQPLEGAVEALVGGAEQRLWRGQRRHHGWVQGEGLKPGEAVSGSGVGADPGGCRLSLAWRSCSAIGGPPLRRRDG